MDGTFTERGPCRQSPSRASRQTGKMMGEEWLRKEGEASLKAARLLILMLHIPVCLLSGNEFGSLDMSLGWRFSAF